MGRILPLRHDLALAGRGDRSALHADEPDRRRRPGTSQSHIRARNGPYSAADVMVVPALNPDVAIVHVQRAMRTAMLISGASLANKRKPPLLPAGHPDRRRDRRRQSSGSRPEPHLIPGFIVDAVCHVPVAPPILHPGLLRPRQRFYLEWDKISETAPASPAPILDEWVYGVKDREEYWQKLVEVHEKLEVSENLSVPVNYGKY